MLDAGKKQADLVRETGIDKGAISSYLSGKYEPKKKAVAALARALNVTEMWLWGYDVPKVRTPEQKKNDTLVDVVSKLRSDPDFFEVVAQLAELPAGEYASIKSIISALRKKSLQNEVQQVCVG
jgi:transcriptional regulator with XRE-family HTH domain